MDISKLSDVELKELCDAANAERESRSYKRKSRCDIQSKLIGMGVKDQLMKEGLRAGDSGSYYTEEHNQRLKIEKSVFLLCNLALGNYEIVSVGTDRGFRKHLRCNGSKLYDNMYDDYMEMSEELMDIFEKHFKKRILNG